eukprot:2687823-Rhodomonas_salina.1
MHHGSSHVEQCGGPPPGPAGSEVVVRVQSSLVRLRLFRVSCRPSGWSCSGPDEPELSGSHPL